MLLKAGASATVLNYKGETPLYKAKNPLMGDKAGRHDICIRMLQGTWVEQTEQASVASASLRESQSGTIAEAQNDSTALNNSSGTIARTLTMGMRRSNSRGSAASTISPSDSSATVPSESILLEPKGAARPQSSGSVVPSESVLLEPKGAAKPQSSGSVVPSESILLEPKGASRVDSPSLSERRQDPSFPIFAGIFVEGFVVRSGQSTVYKGIYKKKNIKVAIKVMHDMQDVQFREELETLMELRHPNVLGIVTVFEKPFSCIVTPWMDGGPLNEWLAHERTKSGRPIDWATAGRRIARDVADGLAYLHSMQKVHRDMKSLNVFLKADAARAVVADFGYAKDLSIDKTSLQAASGVRGTPRWMAPEMIVDAKFTFASDVYALGIILWEIMASDLPFDNFKGSVRQFEDAVIRGLRPPVNRKLWSSRICDLMEICWHENPKMRPSAAQVLKVLEE